MKSIYCIAFGILFSLSSWANNKLKFDKTVIDCEERWVVLRPLADSSYQFGFVFDIGEGLTFRLEGAFKIDSKTGAYKRLKTKKVEKKTSLFGSLDTVAALPYNRFADLGIGFFPSWYEKKGDKGVNVFTLYTEGVVLVRKQEYEKALIPLQQAYTINPDYKLVRLYLAKAFNAVGMSDKAIKPLQDAIKLAPKSYELWEQLSFAQLKTKQFEAAEKSAKKGIKLCKLNPPRCQMALTLAYYYYDAKNKKKFNSWVKVARKYAADGSRQVKQIEHMLVESANWP